MEAQTYLVPVPGTPAYFEARRIAFALIREVEAAKRASEHAPTYVRGRWDEDYDDYEPVENLGPWERLDDAQKRGKANRFVVETLKAQNRLDLLGLSRWDAEAIIHGEPAEILAERMILVPWQGLTYSEPCAYAHTFSLELVRPPHSGCYILTKTTQYWGFRPGKPGRWTEVSTEVLTNRAAAQIRYAELLGACWDFAEQIRARYNRAA